MQLIWKSRAVILLILLSIMIVSTLCDCPISRYHSQIKIGQIKVTQSQTSPDQLVQLNYTYSLDTPFVKANPNIIIGLTGYTYTRAANSVEFEISPLITESLSTLTFTINSKGAIQSLRIFSFRFMVIDKDFTQIQTGTYRAHPITNPVPPSFVLIPSSLETNTKVAIFLNGFKGANLLDAWYVQLTLPRIQASQLKYNFVANLSPDQVDSITYSYLLYNKVAFTLQNQVLLQTSTFETVGSSRLRFNSLEFTDTTFFGLSKISFLINLVHSLDLILDDKSSSDIGLMVQSNLNGAKFEVFIWQSFIKQPYVCSFCKDGSILYDGRYCVSQCPSDTIPQQGEFLQECKKCSMEQIRVLDPVNRRCVCTLQYFQKQGQCTACHFTCLTCMSESSQDCLTCDVSLTQKLTFRQLIKPTINSLTGRCSCPVIGFYEEDMNIRCLACHPDCRTCTGPTDTECVECNGQRIKNELGMCVCKTGYTSQVDGSCVCMNPKYQANGVCINPLNACGLNEIQVVQNLKSNSKINNNGNGNNNNNNKNKNTNPSTLSSTIKTCECRIGFFRVKGQCLPCGPNEEYNDKKGTCRCVKQAVKHSKSGSCVVCSNDKRYDRQTESCICKSKNNALDSQGNCISCPPKSIFYEDQCYCINNYFMNDKKKCQKCKKNADNPQCKRYGTSNE